MKNFKTFLQEAKAEGSPKQLFEPLTEHPAAYYLDKYCPNLFWMLKKNTPLYRGMQTGLPFSFVDLTRTRRKSENTSNWYTAIFDNHPEMKDFPKRSKSLICTTELFIAERFGSQAYAVLPILNAKIGEVGSDDLWDLRTEIFGYHDEIQSLNDLLSDIIEVGLVRHHLLSSSFRLLKEFDKEIKNRDGDVFKQMQDSGFGEYLDNELFVNDFLGTIMRAYSPNTLGMTSATEKTYSMANRGEVWFDTGAIIVPLNKWNEMVYWVKTYPNIKSWQDLLGVMS